MSLVAWTGELEISVRFHAAYEVHRAEHLRSDVLYNFQQKSKILTDTHKALIAYNHHDGAKAQYDYDEEHNVTLAVIASHQPRQRNLQW